jgi:hypothetical protein
MMISIPVPKSPEGLETSLRTWQFCLATVFQPVLGFIALLVVVAGVSVHDAALLLINQDVIADYERNPLGSWLIEVNSGSVWLFIVVKLLGTSVVCSFLAVVYELSRRLAFAVATPLTMFQLVLLGYLYAN